MNAQRLLDTFLELVRIDSPSYHEAEVAAYCAQALTEAGCAVVFDDSAPRTGSDTGNIIATLPGTAAGKVILSAHMDSVEPCRGIEPVIIDGVIRSAGDTVLGADDKVGLAAILETVRTLTENDRPYPEVMVIFSVAEEDSLVGAGELDPALFNGEPCFVLDSDSEPGAVIIGAPYHYSFTAVFHGRAAHAGVQPESGVSAIALAATAIAGMELGRLDPTTTANIGTIKGGRANNIVADTCLLTGECRSLDHARVNEVRGALQQAIVAAADVDGGSVDLKWTLEYPGFMLEEDDPLVEIVFQAAHAVGLTPRSAYTGGGSDANVLAGKGALPITLGTGMSDFHSTDEYLSVADLESCARLATEIVYHLVQ